MSSYTEQLLKEHSRSLRLIEKNLCCAITSVEQGIGNQTFLKGLFSSGVDEMGLLTIDADNAGTYTSIADDGASGTITLDINSGGYAAFVSPLTLTIGDTINAKRTITTADGWYKLMGNF